jgi:DUF438 domain-containing protein
MEQLELLNLLFDSWNDSVVFVDTNHIIRYLNAPARVHYAKWGEVLGKSIFECHNANSCKMIRDCFARLQNGEEEILFADNPKHRVYMRGVRDAKNNLVGYYERYEPPVVKGSTAKPNSYN